jgi:hypothetical protein
VSLKQKLTKVLRICRAVDKNYNDYNSNVLSNDVVGPPPFITPTNPWHNDHNPWKILSAETVDLTSPKVDFMWDYGETKTTTLPTIIEHVDDQKDPSTSSQESGQVAEDWQILADEFPSLSLTPENNNNNNNNNDFKIA